MKVISKSKADANSRVREKLKQTSILHDII